MQQGEWSCMFLSQQEYETVEKAGNGDVNLYSGF